MLTEDRQSNSPELDMNDQKLVDLVSLIRGGHWKVMLV